MTALVASAGAIAVTWLLRVLLITLVPATRLPAAVQRGLPHVGPAALMAVATGALFGSAPSVQPVYLVGAVLTGVLAWWRGNIVLATGVGLFAVAVLQLL